MVALGGMERIGIWEYLCIILVINELQSTLALKLHDFWQTCEWIADLLQKTKKPEAKMTSGFCGGNMIISNRRWHCRPVAARCAAIGCTWPRGLCGSTIRS